MPNNSNMPKKAPRKGKLFRMVWEPTDKGSAPTVYANQLLITHAGSEFYLVFGEFVPPLVLDETELENLPNIAKIQPVVKVVVVPEVMIKFAEAIQQNVDAYQKQRQNQEASSGTDKKE